MQGAKIILFRFLIFNDNHFSNNFDSLFYTLSVILHTRLSLIDRYRHFGLNYCLLLHGLKLEVKRKKQGMQYPNLPTAWLIFSY